MKNVLILVLAVKVKVLTKRTTEEKKMGKKRKTKKQAKEEVKEYITLSLKCPSCDWEWSESIDCELPYLSAQCPKCFHQPIYLISLI